jgi:hypothetical protein
MLFLVHGAPMASAEIQDRLQTAWETAGKITYSCSTSNLSGKDLRAKLYDLDNMLDRIDVLMARAKH